jgi:hypothetical protein
LIAALLLALLVMPSPIRTSDDAVAKQSSPDGGGYRYTDGNKPEPTIKAQYIPVKNNPKAVGLDTSNWGAEVFSVNLGFNFEYYGLTYSKIYVCDYGAMSFTDSSANSFESYWDYSIPSTSRPLGLMAVYWNWDGCQTTAKDRLYVLQTQLDGEKVFIAEWNCNNGGQYEAILYESGMIMFLYQSVQSWYTVGSYCVIGIESPDSTKGTSYQNWKYTSTDLFSLPFAIAFTKETVTVTEVKLENGHGKEGKTIYAGSTDYIFSVDVFHTREGGDILSVLLTLGSYGSQENIRMIYYHKNETFVQLTGDLNAVIVPSLSKASLHDTKYMKVQFAVDFKVAYPSQDMRNVSAKASGKAAVPGFLDVGNIYWVETELEWNGGDLVVWKVSGESKILRDGDYAAAEQTIQFTNVKIFYESSTVQPRSGLVQFNVTDNFDIKKVTYIQPGSSLDVTWSLPDFSTAMSWTFNVFGIAKQKLLSENFKFALTVDADPPIKLKVEDITIRPDSMDDEPSEIDNDQSIYVSWREADDGSSGVGGYNIEATDGVTVVKKSVGPTARSVLIGTDHNKPLPEGTLKIFVVAFDIVGNQQRSEGRTVKIDLTGPSFSITDPPVGTWTVRNDPEVTFMARDGLTGVEGGSLLYRFSRDGGRNYGSWITCSAFGRKDMTVNVTVRPSLQEGKDNMVQIKGTDIASSQEVVSDEFPVWVDSRAPFIKVVEPEVDLNGTSIEWVASRNEPVKVLVHDTLGSGIGAGNISYRYSIDNGTMFSSDMVLEGEGYNNSLGYFEYNFVIRKNWAEGDGNIVIVEAIDNVGRLTRGQFRIRVDMTPELEVLSPPPGKTYLNNVSIPFRVSVTDPDGDSDVSVSWISSLDGIFGNQLSFSSKMNVGSHTITVIVSDGVHEVERTFVLVVRPFESENPENRDTDMDGMNDKYESDNGLDPLKDDADLDLDGDKWTNVQEYYAGTDPLDKGDFPGSRIKEEPFPLLALIALIASILIFIVAGTLLVREARKPAPIPPVPPYFMPPQQMMLPQGPQVPGTAVQNLAYLPPPPALPPASGP